MSSIPCILIPAIVGIICAIIGYILGRLAWNGTEGGRASNYKAELEACRSSSKHLNSKIEKLEVELAESKLKEHSVVEKATKTVMTSPSPIVEKKIIIEKPKATPSKEGSFDAVAAKSALGKKIIHNDLKVVEGIGPKIAELFLAAGVKTWKDLSEITVEKAREILKKAGERYSIHNPGTWPRQAKLMYEGKWKELKAWTDKLDGGKEQ